MDKGSFHVYADRTFTKPVTLQAWNPRRDLVAILVGKDHLQLFRVLGWKRVWSVHLDQVGYLQPTGSSGTTDESTASASQRKAATALTWRPDGKVLAVGCSDGTIDLYDAEKGTLLVTVPAVKTDAGIVDLHWTFSNEHQPSLWTRRSTETEPPLPMNMLVTVDKAATLHLNLSGSFHLGSVNLAHHLPDDGPHEVRVLSLAVTPDMQYITCVVGHHDGTFLIEMDVTGLHEKMATIDKLSRAQQDVLHLLATMHHSSQKMTAEYLKAADEHARQLTAVSPTVDRKALSQMMLDLFIKGTSTCAYKTTFPQLLEERAIEKWRTSVTAQFTHILEQHDAGIVKTLHTLKKIFEQFMGEQLFVEALQSGAETALDALSQEPSTKASLLSAHLRQILFLLHEIDCVGQTMRQALQKEKKGFDALMVWLHISNIPFFQQSNQTCISRELETSIKEKNDKVKENKTPSDQVNPFENQSPIFHCLVDYLAVDFVQSSLSDYFVEEPADASSGSLSQKEQLMERLQHAVINAADPFGRFTTTHRKDVDRSELLPFTTLLGALSELICHYFDTTMKGIISTLDVGDPWRIDDALLQHAAIRFIPSEKEQHVWLMDVALVQDTTVVVMRCPTTRTAVKSPSMMQHASIMAIQTTYDTVDDILWTADDHLTVLGSLNREQQLIEVYCPGATEELGAPLLRTIDWRKAEEIMSSSKSANFSSSLIEMIQASARGGEHFESSSLPASRIYNLETLSYRAQQCAYSGEDRRWLGLTSSDGFHMHVLERQKSAEYVDDEDDVDAASVDENSVPMEMQ